MIEYMKTWLELKTDRRAVTALEYGLIAAVLVTTIVVGFQSFGNALSNSFGNAASHL